MQLRKDPISMNWVVQEDGETTWPNFDVCPFCPGQEALTPQTIYLHVNSDGKWEVRVTPHLRPLYRIEGHAQRCAEGVYDKMRSLGAHEVVIESPDHHQRLSLLSDENVAQVLRAFVSRLADLKKDQRFRYVSVFRNQGKLAGQESDHPHSQISATPFIPRRVVYELRSLQRYFTLKERCLICDIAQQEIAQQVRTVEWNDQFLAFCPFASRAPYEIWVLPQEHHCAFEEDLTSWERQLRLARFLKSALRRLESVAQDYHLILHTTPNLSAKFDRSDHWRTLREDFHWHIELVPVYLSTSPSYFLKEVYYNSVLPERAAEELRKVNVEQLTHGER
jgi:UDPglucose--hexose-1-phosphate uridylyltransferase